MIYDVEKMVDRDTWEWVGCFDDWPSAADEALRISKSAAARIHTISRSGAELVAEFAAPGQEDERA